ncbi:FAD:protein FMN transferase [Undibacterium arcticum]
MSSPLPITRRAQPWLGTLVEISIADADSADAPTTDHAAAFAAAFGAIAAVQRLMSFHDAASDVSRFNRAPVGAVLEVDRQTLQVLQCALQIHAASGGLFDIGCGATLAAWDYLPAPDGLDVPTLASWPRPPLLRIEDARRITKTAAAWIDLGGIAKGYAVDQAIAALQEAGIGLACVNAGGDLRVYGEYGFPVAIRDPRQPGRAARQTRLSNQAMASSGSYFFRRRPSPSARSVR